MPEIVGLEEQTLRLEAEEGLLEARPFLLDDAPDEAGREDALSHGRQDAVVGHGGERGIVRRRPEQRGQHGLAALALGGAGADRLEIGMADLPFDLPRAGMILCEVGRQGESSVEATHEQDRRRTRAPLAGPQADALTEAESRVLQSAIDRKPLSRDLNAGRARNDAVGRAARRRDRPNRRILGLHHRFLVFLLCGRLINTLLLSDRAFDPYPFVFLNLILSMLAAIQAPVIMMSQNRQPSATGSMPRTTTRST